MISLGVGLKISINLLLLLPSTYSDINNSEQSFGTTFPDTPIFLLTAPPPLTVILSE